MEWEYDTKWMWYIIQNTFFVYGNGKIQYTKYLELSEIFMGINF